jgi:tRNA 2-thiouridine synthesizing protein D
MSDQTLTFCLMDPPFESANVMTALRLIDIALTKGNNVNVFAYEGAVGLAFAKQAPHPNKVHGRSVEEEDHPLTKDIVASLLDKAKAKGLKLDWINCGLCVDERGVNESIPGTRRGTPGDFVEMADGSVNTLVIATK